MYRIMMSTLTVCLLLIFSSLSFADVPKADFYQGDTSVYYGSALGAPPNIMFLIDSSQQMQQFGSSVPYRNLNCTYPSNPEDLISCEANTEFYPGTLESEKNNVFQWKKDDFEGQNSPSLSDVKERCRGAYDILNTRGVWSGHLTDSGFQPGCLSSNGSCCTNQSYTYATGDYVGWGRSSSDSVEWTSTGSYGFGAVVYQPGEPGIEYKCSNVGGCSEYPFEWSGATLDQIKDNVNEEWTGSHSLNTVVYEQGTDNDEFAKKFICTDPDPDNLDYKCTTNPFNLEWQPNVTLIQLVADALRNDIFPFLLNHEANPAIGLTHYPGGEPGVTGVGTQGGRVVVAVQQHSDDELLRNMLTDNIEPSPANKTANSQQPASALWDVGLYFTGRIKDSLRIHNQNPDIPSPVDSWCQTNHVIMLVSGTEKENIQKQVITDVDDDGDFDEVAGYLATGYMMGDKEVKVKTHVIQLMTTKNDALEKAVNNPVCQEDDNCGEYIHVERTSDILPALLKILTGVLSETSSFVAPVVPANPENRAFSGDKIYLGFFKPKFDAPWCGNIKKFKLGSDSLIYGFNSIGVSDDDCEDPSVLSCQLKLATDNEGYFVDDGTLQKNPTVRSYWSTVMDGGEVELGGVGQRLINLSASARTIYTSLHKEDNNEVIIEREPFVKNNDSLEPIYFGLENATEKDKLIDFIRGEGRSWMLGDIIHSKPVVVPYKIDGNIKPYIFVGSNGGMLHAFNDLDGSESWSYIPNDLLKSLKYLMDNVYHTYYVDNSPVVYHNDVESNGIVDAGEQVLLISGMRRGGGLSTIPDQRVPVGSYFAIDIGDPTNPEVKWYLNSSSANAKEMGQTWSVPRLTTISGNKVVAIIGAGYDTNEDLRYGNTQTFPTANENTVTSEASNGADAVTSAGVTLAEDRYNPRGRGLYVVDAVNGTVLRGFEYKKSDPIFGSMTFSFPSDPLVIDTNRDGYSDRIYIGDTGGQLWRFDISDPDSTKWNAKLIFQANIGSADVGRKVFYQPTATIKGDNVFVYFGTGDREHPLNTHVLDRFYVVRDRISDAEDTWPLDEDDLVDVTDNDLQNNLEKAIAEKTLHKLKPEYSDYTVGDKTYYGWYIKLDQNNGEKVLALPKVLDNVLFFTTYTPAIVDINDEDYDPCEGVLGPARLYAVDAQTGEAVFNFTGITNYLKNKDGQYIDRDGNVVDEADRIRTLLRADRSLSVGKGIASEPLIIIDKKGNKSVMVGVGGGFFNTGTLSTIDPLFPVYWMKW